MVGVAAFSGNFLSAGQFRQNGVISSHRPAGTHTPGALRRVAMQSDSGRAPSGTMSQAIGRLDKGNGEFDDD
jgi:hypothetical protein